MTRPPHVWVLAGEPSGDRLGAALIRALRAETGGALRVSGVGGAAMQSEGLQSLFPMADISVMGLAEVVPHIPRVLRRLRMAADAVVADAPDVLVTIDAQVFSAMLAKRVRDRAPQVARVQYVAPTVWAWKPWRARKAAEIYDRMLTLFPFEPQFFAAEGLAAVCVGHPLVEQLKMFEAGAPCRLRAEFGIADQAPLLLIAPGSRTSEIDRLMAPFGDACARLSKALPGLRALLPVAPAVASRVDAALAAWPLKPDLLKTDGYGAAEIESRKFAAFGAADAALAASGTVTLELAGTRTPMAVGYRMSRLSEAIARRMIRIETGTLVNIILGRNAVPEFFQENCDGARLAAALAPLLRGEAPAIAQRSAFDEAFARLGEIETPPSVKAAREVLTAIEEKRQRLATST